MVLFELNYTERRSQITAGLIRSLLRQLVQVLSEILTEVSDLYESHSKGKIPLSVPESRHALMTVARMYDQGFIVVDALDECEEIDNTGVALQWS